MLYHLLLPLRDTVGGLNVLRYITFRAALAGFTAFLATALFGGLLIRYLKGREMVEDTAKPDAARLDELHRAKGRTPTMGGLMIIFGVTVATLLWGDMRNLYVMVALFLLVAFGALGLLDDWLKLRHKRTGKGARGLNKRAKLIVPFLLGAAAGTAVWLHTRGGAVGESVYVPFFKNVSLDLGWGIILWVAVVIVAAANSVNITDGLDGLATGCATVTLFALAGLSYVIGRTDFTRHLLLPYVPGAGELSVFCLSMVGAMLGFLWYNCHPAEVFMGDTGSLPLGGLIGFIAAAVKQEVLLLLIGAVFVLEMMSVLLQVGSFKTTGKRIFSIAPFHHALEYRGWHENKITVRLWIMAILAAAFGLATLKLR